MYDGALIISGVRCCASKCFQAGPLSCRGGTLHSLHCQDFLVSRWRPFTQLIKMFQGMRQRGGKRVSVCVKGDVKLQLSSGGRSVVGGLEVDAAWLQGRGSAVTGVLSCHALNDFDQLEEAFAVLHAVNSKLGIIPHRHICQLLNLLESKGYKLRIILLQFSLTEALEEAGGHLQEDRLLLDGVKQG